MTIGDGKIHIFYDNECLLCTRFRDSLKYVCNSPDYLFHGIGHNETLELFPDLNIQEVSETLHIITRENTWLKGGDAIHYLVSECPKVESFKWLIESSASKKASHAFYAFSDQVRRRLKSNCKSCSKE